MPTDESNRFLIAFAKFLGQNPTQPNPLANVQVCKDWFLSELIAPVVRHDSKISITPQSFNQLMLACGRDIATDHFFNYFFKDVTEINGFENAVERFRIAAMWLFGNFRFAYKQLAGCDQHVFEGLIARTAFRSDFEKTLMSRESFQGAIEPIPESDLGFLGYLSSRELADYAFALETLDLLANKWDEREKFLAGLGGDNQQKIVNVLSGKGVVIPSGGLKSLDRGQVTSAVSQLAPDLDAQKKRRDDAQLVGIRNTQRYLTLPYLDVYVATSMRSQKDYEDQHRFVLNVFQSSHVKDLNLRYFDPTASFDHDRIKKGLIECLMLRRASVTIYNAGAEDTMGKDSELAATLAQGKPVIVYVQSEPRFVTVPGRERPVDMDVRAKTFNVDHPLGLQVCTRTGVAHGLIVVRTIDQCAKMLRKVLLHDLSFSIEHEGGNFLLEEKETKSVLRVVTDDALLSHSFWTYFKHTEPEEDI